MKQLVYATAWFLLTLGIAHAQTANTRTQSMPEQSQTLTVEQQNIVAISALTAKGDLAKLNTALNRGLDAGLTINESKEVLVQLYAYCGFPRSLNGINTLMAVIEDRKKKGINDEVGRDASPIKEDGNKYERGKGNLEMLTGRKEVGPKTGFAAFSPEMDLFLKEHLFADIFERDVLSFKDREIATISALAAMTGVEPQLESHLSMGMNTGLTHGQLLKVFDLIEENISRQQAETARRSLVKVMETKQNKNEGSIFPKGDKAPAEYFTGTVYLYMLAPKTESNHYSLGSVTFEPGARSNWHTHPAGQTLIVIDGEGLYQEKGKPIKTIKKGETIICSPNIEHWHGASPKKQMTHIAVTNDTGAGGVVWLKPVTDEEYNAGG
jgi:quercetin dioxygenase-like cupin family protein/alkylhydroperoxidase/carboxymuconolactone decarboxylase family protein YurZ